jgi:hypothetical protein
MLFKKNRLRKSGGYFSPTTHIHFLAKSLPCIVKKL